MYGLGHRIQAAGTASAASKALRHRSACHATPRPVLSNRAPAARNLRVVGFKEDDKDKMKDKLTKSAGDVGHQAKKGADAISHRVTDMTLHNSPQVYVANALVLAVVAGVAAYRPDMVSKVLFQPAFRADVAGLLQTLTRILALGWSAAAVINYVQGMGAARDDLVSALHRRLNNSLSTFSVAQLALLGLCLTPLSRSILMGYHGASVLNTAGLAALGVGVVLQLYVAGVNHTRNAASESYNPLADVKASPAVVNGAAAGVGSGEQLAGEGYNPMAGVKSWFQDAFNTFRGIKGPMPAAYALLTASLLTAGLGYLFAPYPTLLGVLGSSATAAGPESIVLWQLIGAGVSMLLAPVAYSLKEGAAFSLSEGRYKLLNFALATAGIGHWVVLQPRLESSITAGPLMPIVLGTWAAAALLGCVNLLR